MLKRGGQVAEGRQGARSHQPLGVVTEINLHVRRCCPTTTASDVHERLVLYKRLANCDSEEQLRELQEELIDRFGELPEQTQHADRLPPPAPARIIQLIQKKKNYKLAGQDRLRIETATPDLKSRVTEIRRVFAELA
jgi:transcription-repair coupling factor (superfamily II helicase)